MPYTPRNLSNSLIPLMSVVPNDKLGLSARPDLTLVELATAIGMSVSAVERATAKLVKAEKLRFIGAKKAGRWDVLT